MGELMQGILSLNLVVQSCVGHDNHQTLKVQLNSGTSLNLSFDRKKKKMLSRIENSKNGVI